MGRTGMGAWGAAVVAMAAGAALPLGAQDGPCRPVEDARPAPAILGAARAATGTAPGRVIRYRFTERDVQAHQSDRPYPPYLSAFSSGEASFDPVTGAEHRTARLLYPASGPMPPRTTVVTSDAAFLVQDTLLRPLPQLLETASRSRALNPLAVLGDWRPGTGARVAGECRFREDWRIVLEREGRWGPERLFLDRETGLPVKLERTEPHATWGQRRVEVLWSLWWRTPAGRFPLSAFVLADGEVILERTVGDVATLPRDSAALPPLPEVEPVEPDPFLLCWTRPAPDTVRVGEGTFVLSHWGYNEALVAAGDTVFLLDATIGEARARQDSAWIHRLFPDHREVKVVVTDVAWPHVGGVRFWVARGATVVAHRDAEPFLRRVVERRWTLAPDALEEARSRGPVDFRFEAVEDEATLGGGALRLHVIGGIGSEGALMAWVPRDAFLWPGDFVQTVDGASIYAGDVVRAAGREGLEPRWLAAQHQGLVRWEQVVEANPPA